LEAVGWFEQYDVQWEMPVPTMASFLVGSGVDMLITDGVGGLVVSNGNYTSFDDDRGVLFIVGENSVRETFLRSGKSSRRWLMCFYPRNLLPGSGAVYNQLACVT
jgi:hypothetical protein